MKLDKESSEIFTNVRQITNVDIQSIRVEYCREEYVGSYTLYYTDRTGKSEMVSPGDYQLSLEESAKLNDFLLSQKLKGEKTNKLNLVINSDLSYTVETLWDQNNYEINKAFKQKAQEQAQAKINSRQTDSNLRIGADRFSPYNEFAAKQRVLSFDLSEPKITAQIYARIYSLLEIDPQVNYEGFLFSIIDNETGLHFCAGCTASGIGYYANDANQSIIENIKEFHNYIFSDSIQLKECSLSYEHDFGKTTIGYMEGKIYELTETE